MKRKLVLKESVIDTLIDINLILVMCIIFSKGTLFMITAGIMGIIDLLVIIIYGSINYE